MQNKYIIYHELGHLFGYRLSRKYALTDLGEVAKFEVGITNCVSPLKKYYHFEIPPKLGEDQILKDEVWKSTSKIERTLAWFIEVIAGCTMQCCFKQVSFKQCFGPELVKTGRKDFDNMSGIRSLSSFIWTFHDIDKLQYEFEENIIKKHHIIERLEPIVVDIEAKIIDSSEKQICLENQDLKELAERVDKLITPEIIDDYLKLINRFKEILS